MSIRRFNALDPAQARQQLYHCLSCDQWVQSMMSRRPFDTSEQLKSAARQLFDQLDEVQLLEAFDGHPKIGDVNSLKEKYAATRAMAGSEQSSVQHADDAVLARLAEGNKIYEEKFGFIFIVFATGKSAAEMLELLQQRLPNSRQVELQNAAAEQLKITLLRLEKML